MADSAGRIFRLRMAASVVAIIRAITADLSGVFVSSFAKKNRDNNGHKHAAGKLATVHIKTILVRRNFSPDNVKNNSSNHSDNPKAIIEAGIVNPRMRSTPFLRIFCCRFQLCLAFDKLGNKTFATENPTIESKKCPRVVPRLKAEILPATKKLAITTSIV